MPEGDTLRKTANALQPLLVGRPVRRLELRHRTCATDGLTVAAVEAVGKHLLVTFSDGTVLRTHLGLHGSWHRYDPGERWRRPSWQVAAMLETDADVLVCFQAKEVELRSAREAARDPALARLGPDLLAPDPPLDDIVADAYRRGDVEIADVLLDQSVAAGLGNVFKSEMLFLESLDPRTPVSAVPPERVRRLFALGVELLHANIGPWHRTTTVDRRRRGPPAQRLWVYGRRGRPCLRCGAVIERIRQGPHARSTYFCPVCQPRP